ncbi:hypothetical protein BD779DRAFT_1526109 [Infundibulicybe gibba]|nr:hypothetical protein BD779DRAFT_1526109 [Infundibulicybe gibba]
MSLGANATRSMSHEEDRVKEYLTAARITGLRRYPLHSEGGFECGADMEDLAPAFRPISVAWDEWSGPADPPPYIEKVVDRYQSISCQTKFLKFSHEELRYADYIRGYRPRLQDRPTSMNTINPRIEVEDNVLLT